MPLPGSCLREILCIQEERVVGNDNCVRYQGKILQLQPDRYRCHIVKGRVKVHSYPDGSTGIFHGPMKLASYDASGELIEKEAETKEAAA